MPDPDYVQAKYDDLEGVAVRFSQWAQSNAQISTRVRQKMEDLINGGWEGRGAEAFFNEMGSEVLPAIDRLTVVLEQSQDVTRQIISTFQEAEREAASVFTGQGAEPLSGSSATSTSPSDLTTAATPRPAVANVPPYDYAVMSAAVYDGASLPSALREKGWQQLVVGQTDTGYYGVAHVNHSTGEVVIAHRGTDTDFGDFAGIALEPTLGPLRSAAEAVLNPDGSDLDDDLEIWMGQAPDQYSESRNFVRGVQRRMQEMGIGHYKVTHTGHSLGGTLADLHAAEHGHRAITFDNPGAREPLASLGRAYNPENHIAYQSNPNPINQTNQQAGYATRIRFSREPSSNPVTNIWHLSDDHSMEKIVRAIDPRTGFPRTQGDIHKHTLE